MRDWTEGYVADIDYTYGYYAELNPLRSQLAIIYVGLVPPTHGSHCELGFGQGLSVNIHARADLTDQAFAEKLFATEPRFAKANPHVAERVKKIKEQDRNYVAHEYFNRDWLPMPFSHMAQWFSSAKLDYACSTFYSDQIDPLNFTPAQLALLKEIPDRMFREAVRDFIGQPHFVHDFENVEYDAPDFDLQLGVPGLHRVKPKVAFTERHTIIPPDLFEKYSKMTFWTVPSGSAANVIAQKSSAKENTP
jgi:hypothetical protein